MNNWDYLFEVLSQSNQEKMAQQNLEANFSDYRNWMNLITLTKNRGKAIKVTLNKPIRSIDMGALGVSVPFVKAFIVMAKVGKFNDLDVVGLSPSGKLKGHFILGVNEVYKAGPSIEIVKRPNDNPKANEERPKPEKTDLPGYLRLLSANYESITSWKKAFLAAEKSNKELVITGLDPYPVAVTDVYVTLERVGIETRDSASIHWSRGINIKGLNTRKIQVTAKTKGWNSRTK